MTFSYDPSGTDDEKTVARLRPIIGDTRQNRGPRPAPPDAPAESNYSDEELLAWYAEEESHKMKVAALVYETLAAEWAQFAGRNQLGPESRESKASETYMMMAKMLRDKYGYSAAAGEAKSFSAQLNLLKTPSE
jgi:hypothetical protein